MNTIVKVRLLSVLAIFSLNTAVLAQEEGKIPSAPGDMPPDVQEFSSTTRTESSSSSNSVSSSSSSTSSSSSSNTNSSNSNTTSETINPDIRPQSKSSSSTSFSVTRKFVPKFKERLNDLAEQVKMALSKGWINADESAKFMERQTKLLAEEAEANKQGYPKAAVDNLEKEVTLLNGDLFKAMHKTDPVKPGPADKEVNDPNLIPAYPDPELQPNSGTK